MNQPFCIVFANIKQVMLIFTLIGWNWLAFHAKVMKYHNSFWDTTWFLHHVLAAFAHFLYMLNLETHADHYNNNLFCTTTYYWPPPHTKETKESSLFNFFFSASVVVHHFINGPFEISQQLTMEKSLENNRKCKRL